MPRLDAVPQSVHSGIEQFIFHLEAAFKEDCLEGVRQSKNGEVATLGKQLRKRKVDVALSSIDKDHNLFRCTENRRAFYYVLIQNLANHPEKIPFVIVLSKEFNTVGKLVDSSAIGLNEVEEQLLLLERGLKVILDRRQLYVVEVSDFFGMSVCSENDVVYWVPK